MEASLRRKKILDLLRESAQPVSAGTIAARFQVSRQVIVGDIALLRAANEDISATPRGYILNKQEPSPDGTTHTIACRHGPDNLAEELYTIVDSGCGILDVIVEHSVYGQISGQLHIFSRYDADNFLQKITNSQSAPLCELTGGIHLHTISCRSEEAFQHMLTELKRKGILLDK